MCNKPKEDTVMDKKSELTYKFIETAVDKGIRDIKENSNRGIRNLLDLGNHFATGRFQKDFFNIASQMLNNENSIYYDIVNNLVQNVDPQIIKHFGINLGYNSWTYGAEKIRRYEKKNGYNIPWTIVFDFLYETENNLSTTDVSKILDNLESMGVYSAMFFMSKSKGYFKSILNMLNSHKSSSYFIFIEPELITEEIAELITEDSNIVVALAINTIGDNTSTYAARLLESNNCLYGSYTMYNDDNLEYVLSKDYLGQIEDLHCTFAFFVKQLLNDPKNTERFSQFMETAKNANNYQFFPIDFYEDLAYVDKNISVEDCFMAIKSDGAIAISTMDTLVQELNINTHTLQTILEKNMPKTQYV